MRRTNKPRAEVMLAGQGGRSVAGLPLMSVLPGRMGGSHSRCTKLVRLCRASCVLGCSEFAGHRKSTGRAQKGGLHDEVSESHTMYF